MTINLTSRNLKRDVTGITNIEQSTDGDCFEQLVSLFIRKVQSHVSLEVCRKIDALNEENIPNTINDCASGRFVLTCTLLSEAMSDLNITGTDLWAPAWIAAKTKGFSKDYAPIGKRAVVSITVDVPVAMANGENEAKAKAVKKLSAHLVIRSPSTVSSCRSHAYMVTARLIPTAMRISSMQRPICTGTNFSKFETH